MQVLHRMAWPHNLWPTSASVQAQRRSQKYSPESLAQLQGDALGGLQLEQVSPHLGPVAGAAGGIAAVACCLPAIAILVAVRNLGIPAHPGVSACRVLPRRDSCAAAMTAYIACCKRQRRGAPLVPALAQGCSSISLQVLSSIGEGASFAPCSSSRSTLCPQDMCTCQQSLLSKLQDHRDGLVLLQARAVLWSPPALM